MNEKDIQNQIRDYLKALGWFVVRMHQGPMSYKGIPDLMAYGPKGKRLDIEVKTAKGQLSVHQEAYREWLIHLGHEYVVARSVEDVMEALK